MGDGEIPGFLSSTPQLFYSKSMQFCFTATPISPEVQRKIYKTPVRGWIMAPKYTQVLVPGTCACYLTCQEFADVIKNQEMRRLSWITRMCPKYNHKCLYKREAADKRRLDYTEGSMTTSAERDFKMLSCWLWRWKTGSQSQSMQGRQLWELENLTN